VHHNNDEATDEAIWLFFLQSRHCEEIVVELTAFHKHIVLKLRLNRQVAVYTFFVFPW